MEKKENFKFRCLKKNEILKCAELILETFSKFDPFILKLKLSIEELKDTVINDLNKIIDDNLITICLDDSNNIIGCYAGFKLNHLPEIKILKKRNKFITYNPEDIITKLQKLSILENIDNNLIYEKYLMHELNNELDKTIFCDYYCISLKYFQTNLAKLLAFHFFENCKMEGIENIYGSFYNIKAIKLLKKNFDANIVDKIKVKFTDDNSEFDVLLLHGNLNHFKSKF